MTKKGGTYEERILVLFNDLILVLKVFHPFFIPVLELFTFLLIFLLAQKRGRGK